MPLYEYKCKSCEQSFQVQARMSDPEPQRAPDCQRADCSVQKSLSRVFGVVAGAHQAPAERPAPARPQLSAAEHICSKYCDQHGSSKRT